MEEIAESCTNSSTFVEIDADMAKLPQIDEKTLGINPFTQELVIECTKLMIPDAMVMDEEGIMLPASMVIEKQKAMKVFRYPGAKERAMGLSVGALRMFVYIQYTVKAGKDWIQLTPDQYVRSVGKGGRNVHKKAIEELHRYGYIQPTVKKYVYWVNQCLMYAGDRIRKWPQNVVVKNEWTPDKQTDNEE